jgi:3-deoxy-manno-octulosonate cytidylyltransferase (CMP-KDO synthetase)
VCYSHRVPDIPMNPNGSIAIIPARYQSSRLPGKPLRTVAGRTLIEHVYRRVAQVRGLDRTLVATDDRRILEAVEAFGGEAVLTRSDHRTGTDRLGEVAAGLDETTLVVNVQGDEPLIEPEVIERALEAAGRRDADVVTLMTPLADLDAIRDPANVKVVTDQNGMALYFSRSPVPSSGTAFLHLGLYVYSAGFLATYRRLEPTRLERAERLEQLRVLEHGFRIRVVEVESRSWGIDTPADLEAFERLFADGDTAGGGEVSHPDRSKEALHNG